MSEKELYNIGITKLEHIKILLYEIINLLNPNLHYKNLFNKNITKWNNHDLGTFLKHIGLIKYFNLFIENEITGNILSKLSINQLQSIGIDSEDIDNLIDNIKQFNKIK